MQLMPDQSINLHLSTVLPGWKHCFAAMQVSGSQSTLKTISLLSERLQRLLQSPRQLP
jgi:hypothetical protein